MMMTLGLILILIYRVKVQEVQAIATAVWTDAVKAAARAANEASRYIGDTKWHSQKLI